MKHYISHCRHGIFQILVDDWCVYLQSEHGVSIFFGFNQKNSRWKERGGRGGGDSCVPINHILKLGFNVHPVGTPSLNQGLIYPMPTVSMWDVYLQTSIEQAKYNLLYLMNCWVSTVELKFKTWQFTMAVWCVKEHFSPHSLPARTRSHKVHYPHSLWGFKISYHLARTLKCHPGKNLLEPCQGTTRQGSRVRK